ncbi:hypothetical protein GXM_02377 [Nostoc sphaeroides CCNUC1]|uniref:Uncharacterized protein n=1 Tax=Nostoc sphaeroides CCNUC1 TaxID=2653204 RepID=A0A5P8VWW3_9NOSO|nr:hypothetical protein GXM_02377 [Nostoc sphaeroides CCNUC1]
MQSILRGKNFGYSAFQSLIGILGNCNDEDQQWEMKEAMGFNP